MKYLLAEHAGNESLGVAAFAAGAAGQIDLRRANFGGGHVQAHAALEALRLAHASAAATQSGAPLGATLHFSWPRKTRVLGRRATASAAALALSTVVRAAMPASWPKFWNRSRMLRMPELKLSADWSNQRPILAKKPCGSGAGALGRVLRGGQRRAQNNRGRKQPAEHRSGRARLGGTSSKPCDPWPVKLTYVSRLVLPNGICAGTSL